MENPAGESSGEVIRLNFDSLGNVGQLASALSVFFWYDSAVTPQSRLEYASF